MFSGTFEEFENSGFEEKFDLIYIAMVLEHIVNPLKFVKSLAKYNRKYIFVEVPTLDLKNIDEPFGMFCEEHVNMFTFESLNNLMAKAGYGLVDAKIELGFDKGYPAAWPAIDSIWELGRRVVPYRATFDSRFLFEKYISENEKVLASIEKKINEIPNDEKIAVYGTGHHVSMLLKNTELGKKNIVKFYDSDTRKHAYTMHGKSINSFSRSDRQESQIEGIVIGSYIFQEEISKLIVEKDSDVKIYRLYDKAI